MQLATQKLAKIDIETYETDYEFSIELIKHKLLERLDWLEKSIYDNMDMQSSIDQLEIIYELLESLYGGGNYV